MVCRLLNPEGRFAVVLPDSVFAEFQKTAEKNGLFLHKRVTIIPIAEKEPNRVNLELGFGKVAEIQEETFTIRDRDKRFTPQYNEFLKDFYLGL